MSAAASRRRAEICCADSITALLVSLLLKPAVTFFHEKCKLPRKLTGRYNYAYEVDIDAVLGLVDRL